MKYEIFEERRRDEYVSSTSALKKNFFGRAGDYVKNYWDLSGRFGFISMFPVGFVAGCAGAFLYDSGKSAYDTAFYLMNNFPNYSATEVFSRVVNYIASVPIESFASGMKDGVIAGLGGSIFARWIKRKLFGN